MRLADAITQYVGLKQSMGMQFRNEHRILKAFHRHVGDVGVRRAPVGLVGELDDGVRLVVEEAVEPGELALCVIADPVGNLEVLAPDDRPHGTSPRRGSGEPGARANGPADQARWDIEYRRGLPAGRPSSSSHGPTAPSPR